MSERTAITVEMLCVRFAGLRRDDLYRWIDNAWVRPDDDAGQYVFRDIDVERVRLILVLRDEMTVDEESLPVVLSLLDQLYDLRRRVIRLRQALEETVTGEARRALLARLDEQGR
jgi:chaperone modulatory protein CbpM